jgi:hypothetical protein
MAGLARLRDCREVNIKGKAVVKPIKCQPWSSKK